MLLTSSSTTPPGSIAITNGRPSIDLSRNMYIILFPYLLENKRFFYVLHKALQCMKLSTCELYLNALLHSDAKLWARYELMTTVHLKQATWPLYHPTQILLLLEDRAIKSYAKFSKVFYVRDVVLNSVRWSKLGSKRPILSAGHWKILNWVCY